jgi:hypothetical protein
MSFKLNEGSTYHFAEDRMPNPAQLDSRSLDSVQIIFTSAHGRAQKHSQATLATLAELPADQVQLTLGIDKAEFKRVHDSLTRLRTLVTLREHGINFTLEAA